MLNNSKSDLKLHTKIADAICFSYIKVYFKKIKLSSKISILSWHFDRKQQSHIFVSILFLMLHI